MRLLKLRIKNFRGISCGENGKGIEVRLDDQNIIFLIGKNNIGKSSILYASILRTFFEPELETRILSLKSSQVRSLKPAFCRCL